MSQQFNIEIISPDKSIYSSKVVEAVLPCFEGQITILKDHIPLITFLRPGLIELENNKKFYVEDGTVEFSNNNLLILTSTAKSLDSLDRNSIDTIIKNSQEKINKDEISDKERYLLSYKIDILREINK